MNCLIIAAWAALPTFSAVASASPSLSSVYREAAAVLKEVPVPPPARPVDPLADLVAAAIAPVVGSTRAPAVVVGVIVPAGSRVFGYGETIPGGGVVPGGDTVFEIGSITKVFTGLLLAETAERGEVSLDDPVSALLPAGTRIPSGRRAITLRDLSAHISGLPKLYDDFNPRDPANPYADYTAAKLFADLASHPLTREPGVRIEYSNLGAGLLGDALALKARKNYEDIVRERIGRPLGMSDTTISLTASQKARLAPGHADARIVPGWDFASLQGAGALRSTVNDLIRLLQAQLGGGALGAAVRETQKVHSGAALPSGNGIKEVALGWVILEIGGKRIYFHNGGTGGYSTSIAFIPESATAVVVLANSYLDDGAVDRAALKILLSL